MNTDARYYQESGNQSMGLNPVVVIAGIALLPLMGFGLGLIVIGILGMIGGHLERKHGLAMVNGLQLDRSTVRPTEPGGDGLYPVQKRSPAYDEKPEDYETNWAYEASHTFWYWWWRLWLVAMVLLVVSTPLWH